MEKERPTFDSIMRDALGGIGTSMSFTRRVMVRIETEKEMMRIARMERIIRITGIIVGIVIIGFIVLTAAMAMDIIPSLTMGGENIWTETINAYILSLKEIPPTQYIVGSITVMLAVMAFIALDRVLKKEYN
jgi:hypothetical protein